MEKNVILNEFIENCKSRDFIKASLVLKTLDKLDEDEQKRVLYEITKSEDEFAVAVLIHLSTHHPDIFNNFSVLNHTLIDKAKRVPNRILQGVTTPAKEQNQYIKIAGQANLRIALPELRKLLTNTSDESIIEASLNALGNLKDNTSIGSIHELITSSSAKIRIAGIEALGKIGSRRAVDRMVELLDQPGEIVFSILDTLFEMANETAISILIGTLGHHQTKVRNYGKTKLLELGGKVVPGLIECIDKDDGDQQIHALNLLGLIPDQRSLNPVRKLLNTHPPNPNVRFAAFEALAELPGIEGDYVLTTGLTDEDEAIRLAAAKAIDSSADRKLWRGVRNMIDIGDAESIRITRSIIDSPTQNLFIEMLESESFKKIALKYIAVNAHQDIKRHYLKVLENADLTDSINQINAFKPVRVERNRGLRVCAVDDSSMILSVYRRILNELDYDALVFQYPDDFLKWMRSNTPRVVFTDLNMPEINGIELIHRIRQEYASEQVSIIMVTTLCKPEEKQRAEEAGVDRIIQKPFDRSVIEEVLDSLL